MSILHRKRKCKRVRPGQALPLANVNSLRITSVRALRLYRKIATDSAFAARLAALLKDQLSTLEVEKLIQTLYTRRISVTELGGFFVCFTSPRPTNCFGTFPFALRTPAPNAAQLRTIALAMIPLYLRISLDRVYAARLVRAINTNNSADLTKAVREVVTAPQLVRVEVTREQPSPEFEPDIGFSLFFRLNNRLYYSIIA
ncbi:hypothetical protein [Paenibacillus sedimenti]|uniref:Uncharacterized protein n=1 Tax=Paenibacillus sedimenti TaxID=2770274 RepID=A0A926QGX0_9BACL|nr:hypothetical protein [Paenibacillus sedimenti]MBD0378896.1 hypothetical protein [Paenibacillus sedimenti]